MKPDVNPKVEMSFLWALYGGIFDSEGGVESIFECKKDAIDYVKKDGYKHNKEQDLYLDYESGTWYRIEKIDYYRRIKK